MKNKSKPHRTCLNIEFLSLAKSEKDFCLRPTKLLQLNDNDKISKKLKEYLDIGELEEIPDIVREKSIPKAS